MLLIVLRRIVTMNGCSLVFSFISGYILGVLSRTSKMKLIVCKLILGGGSSTHRKNSRMGKLNEDFFLKYSNWCQYLSLNILKTQILYIPPLFNLIVLNILLRKSKNSNVFQSMRIHTIYSKLIRVSTTLPMNMVKNTVLYK